ncbi:MAG: cobalamin biosynthesis protein [Candidatus Verstraetearchaeota archaeon]|nr:cobalamin biosynthesis protein [Candidatus Verstraetearchaeota archaeon]
MISEPIILLWLAFFLDLIVGEPPSFLHLTVWIGRSAGIFESLLRNSIKRERFAGILLALLSLSLFISFVFVVTELFVGTWWLKIAVSTLILKMTFAFNSMFRHVLPIMRSLDYDLVQARRHLSLVVRRDTSSLDEAHVASGAIETVAEGFVDGFISPIFYYSLFGLPGAVAYRVINTLDSMVGYKDERYLRLGWFSAKLDTIANYVPARLASVIFVFSAFILGKDWNRGICAAKKYHSATESINAGWPMSTMAGVLGVRLEKVGAYVLGEEYEPPSSKKIQESLKVFSVAAVFTLILSSLLIMAVGWIHEMVFV